MADNETLTTGGLRFELQDGVAWLTMDRPEVQNAMDQAMTDSLVSRLEAFATDDRVKVVVLRGAGASFSAGGDLGAGADILKESREERAIRTRGLVAGLSAKVARALQNLPQPLIVSTRGHAIGIGFMFVAAADLVIASENTKFAFPYVKLGHSMDHGESFFVLRKLGMARTMQVMLTGETWSAADAERYGMINWVVLDNELEARTTEIATRLASGASFAIARTKRLLRDAPGQSLDNQLAAEAQSVGECAASEDFEEAIKAFFEKSAVRSTRAGSGKT